MTALYNAFRAVFFLFIGGLIIFTLVHNLHEVRLPSLPEFGVVLCIGAVMGFWYWSVAKVSSYDQILNDGRKVSQWMDGRERHEYPDGTIVEWDAKGSLTRFDCADKTIDQPAINS
jgi:hypothetical protein